MMINRADLHNQNLYHNSVHSQAKFVRMPQALNRGHDRLEISDAARERMIIGNIPRWANNLIGLVSMDGRSALHMLHSAESGFAAERQSHLKDIQQRIGDGSYDFDGDDIMSQTGSEIIGQIL
jgi:hypothetical protein